jgi:transposase
LAPIEVAYGPVQRFMIMVREPGYDRLDDLLAQATSSKVNEGRTFANGLRIDYAAVKAALQTEWSNGQTEGQVNKLKLLKRSMYGRAKLDLLRARLLGAP